MREGTALPDWALPDWALEERFIRASGPGGQNVNKVSTAVELRYHSGALPPAAAERLLRLAGRRATRDGVVVLLAQRFRTQDANRADARDRLAALIARALEAPPPARVKTKPTRASKERRLVAKAQRGAVKALRGRPRGEGE